MVLAIPGALHKARHRAQIDSISAVWRRIPESSPSRAMVHRVFNGAPVSLMLAERIADALGVPVATVFALPHGQSLAS